MEIIILNDKLEIPSYATTGSAAVDLQANIEEAIWLNPGECTKVGTGVKLWLSDASKVALVMPRSGLGSKGYGIKNLTGVIDSDYQGEIIVTVWNTNDLGSLPIQIEPLQKIAQMLIVDVHRPVFTVVQQFSKGTVRGEGGFGSTDARIKAYEVVKEHHNLATVEPVQTDLFNNESNEYEIAFKLGCTAGTSGITFNANPFKLGTVSAQGWEDGRYLHDHSTKLKEGE